MRKVTAFFLMIILALAWSGCEKPEEDPAIARVNGVEIRRSQLQQAARRRAAFFQQQGQPIPPDIMQQAMQLLIQNELLYQEGARLDIPELQTTIEQQYNELAARFPSEEALQASLAQGNTTPEMVKADLRRDAIINNLVENEVAGDIEISEKEVKNHYKENREKLKRPETVNVRHILVSLPPSATEEEEKAALEKIAEVQKRLKKGETFEELAAIYSDHPTSAQGGDLGTIMRGRIDPEFEEAAFSARVGKIGKPVKTQMGYHLIRVDAKEKSRIPSYKEVEEIVREKLKRDEVNKRMSAYLGEIAARSTIETIPQPLP